LASIVSENSVRMPGVGRRIRARSAADRRLIDVHDLVEVLQPGHAPMAAGNLSRPVELVGEHLVEDVVDEARLARSAHAGHGDERAEREAHGHILEVVRLRALHGDLPVLVDRAAPRGHVDRPSAGEVVAGDGSRVLQQRGVVAGVHDLPAVLPRAGSDVDEPIGGADGVFVVLDDDERVAEVLELHEGVDEPPVVALVQADARFVEHIQHAGQARPDLRREPDALRLTTRQRCRRAGHREIPETHFEQEFEPEPDLAQHLGRDVRLPLAEGEPLHELVGPREAQIRNG
jgi:hypothetical protein